MSEASNALQHNIQKKGKNAYYYAHANSSETVKNYGGAPQRLSSKTFDEVDKTPLKTTIKKYAWSDGKKGVKIYIEMEGIGEHPEDQIEISHESKSVRVLIKDFNGENYELALLKLFETITGAKFVQKPSKLVVTLLKDNEEISWHKLQI